ncbi:MULTISPECIES: CoA transferase [unclassified Mycobacterium]|uniref:CoA transferase n=1 Tax=unclassified Mycobacterium TaxID=2642494 RepID=UPI0029C7C0F7|nr:MULTISPECIES: CoA transferase [unclassified Mycobacterium]
MGAVDTAMQDWGAGGLAYLTGQPSGAPDFSRAAVLGQARRVADSYRVHTGVRVDAAVLLAGRAGMLGLARNGRTSAGGASRLLRCRDGWCALTLSRPDDVAAVPAMVEAEEPQADPWSAVESWAAGRSAVEVVERARLLDLPAAVLGERRCAAVVEGQAGPADAPRHPSGLLVVDMSAMWAGPLCGQLLAQAGATVVKIESPKRPDGTRAGPQAFFDWMNAGKLSYAVDFDDVERLSALLEVADVVIESSRPAALRRRGLGYDGVVPRPGRVWLRITGHGADGEQANWVGFGDDAAVAGGLVGTDGVGPVFCADAVADPLTGLQSALAVTDALARGGGVVVDVAMAGVAASYAELPRAPSESGCAAMPPPLPIVAGAAARLGEHNAYVERLVDERRLASC